MYSKTAGLLMFGLVVAVPLSAAPQVENAQNASVSPKPLGSPADGRFRPSDLPGIEETYLTPVFASSHAANLLMLKSGDLLCVWFSGSREGDSDVGIMMARLPKGSKQWSEPRRIDHHLG